MLEILQYYTSGFWVWAGITFGGAIILTVVSEIVLNIVRRK